MEEWEEKWFTGHPMPPHRFPLPLIQAAHSIAEEWLFEETFHCILAEWVSSRAADEAFGGLLWTGFTLQGRPSLRVEPVPVLVRLFYAEAVPMDGQALRVRMRDLFSEAVREWIRSLDRYGSMLRIAP